jgi:signal transduction histidine kinase
MLAKASTATVPERNSSFAFRQIKDNLPYLLMAVFACAALAAAKLPNSSWTVDLTKNYLAGHVLLEFIGILVSFSIGAVGWATYDNALDFRILVLSVAGFAIGLLDLGHTLSFTGMPDFVGHSGPNKAIAFWLASRSLGAFAFLYVAVSRAKSKPRTYMRWILLGIALAWVAICYDVILLHVESLPVFFTESAGLTTIKKILEWSLVAVSLIASVLFFLRVDEAENLDRRWMACACGLFALTGYFFTGYRHFDDLYNFAGHCLKAVSALMLYRAVFSACVARPYERVEILANEASAASLSKSRFLASVSHELRTPLGVIVGFSDLLLSGGQQEPDFKKNIQTIARNATQLNLLIDDLLDLTKAENAKLVLHFSRFNLSQCVLQVCEAMRAEAEKKGILIAVEAESGVQGWIVSDELRVRQILMNVIGNAVKFTARGSIAVRVLKEANKSFLILVQDTGIGINEKNFNRLFKPFSQVTNPLSRQYSGTGLGLSLSRQLAELLGGKLELVSSKPGQGSIFSIALADRAETRRDGDDKANGERFELSPAASPPHYLAPSFKGRTILVAEDSKDNQTLLTRYLHPTGIDISIADDGLEAVELARKGKYDLVLMDIQMPNMDGFEATENLRAEGFAGKIVALTAHALKPERERAMASGFNGYLVKPITKTQLWAAIEGLCDDSRL